MRAGKRGKGTPSEAALAVLVRMADDATLDRAMRTIERAAEREAERDFWLRASVHLQAAIEGKRQSEGRQPYWQERAAEDEASKVAASRDASIPPPPTSSSA